jgi:hypothetical protein
MIVTLTPQSFAIEEFEEYFNKLSALRTMTAQVRACAVYTSTCVCVMMVHVCMLQHVQEQREVQRQRRLLKNRQSAQSSRQVCVCVCVCID